MILAQDHKQGGIEFAGSDRDRKVVDIAAGASDHPDCLVYARLIQRSRAGAVSLNPAVLEILRRLEVDNGDRQLFPLHRLHHLPAKTSMTAQYPFTAGRITMTFDGGARQSGQPDQQVPGRWRMQCQ